MLIPAIILKNEIQEAFKRYYYSDDMMYETGGLNNWLPNIQEETEIGRFQFAIVNSKENKLTAIDFNKNIYNESLKPLSYTFSALDNEFTTPEQAKTFANKILNAALEEFEPGHKPFWNVTFFDFSALLQDIQHKSDFGNTPQSKLLAKCLNTLKDLKVQDNLGNDVSKNLDFMLQTIKCLIKQNL